LDPSRFDALTKAFGAVSSRRGAVTALLTVLAVAGAARFPAVAKPGKGKKGKGKGKDKGGKNKGKGKNRKARKKPAGIRTTPATCYPNTKCDVGAQKNAHDCNFEHSTVFSPGRNLFLLNASGANFRNVVASSDFTRANLSNACLVGADFSAATFSSTNTAGAIFCRTTLPGGAIDNSDCANGTPCCPTCDATHRCPDGQVCCDGRCRPGNCCTNEQCATGICCNGSCCLLGTTCQNGRCACAPHCEGKVCGADGCGGSCGNCPPNAACNVDGTTCVCDFVTCNGVCCTRGEHCVGNVCRPPCGDGNPCGANQVCCDGECFPGICCANDAFDPLCPGDHPSVCHDHQCIDCLTNAQCVESGRSPNTTCCGGVCRNTRTDRRNCGSCGHQCDIAEPCEDGHCVPVICTLLTRLCDDDTDAEKCCEFSVCDPNIKKFGMFDCQGPCTGIEDCHNHFPWAGDNLVCQKDLAACLFHDKCCLPKPCSRDGDCDNAVCCGDSCCLPHQKCFLGLTCVDLSLETPEPPGLRSCLNPDRGQDLNHCDLRARELRGVDLRGTDLSDASFAFARLCGVDLRGATLDRVDFSQAILARTDLRGTDLTTTTLTGAVFCRTRMPDGTVDDTHCPPAGNAVCCAENDCITV
jgi:uncharacterized protein YjbI with pentapeptide repeats